MPQSLEISIPEISFFLSGQVIEFAEQSTETILEGHQSKLKKLFNRFSNNSEKQQRRTKLRFHLFIAYLTLAAVELQASPYFRSHSQQIISVIVELLYESLNKDRKVFDAGDFIKDEEERNIILAQLRHVDSKAFGALTRLPRMGLAAIADMLFEKRLNEYRQLWISDIQRVGQQEGFMPLMPGKVYQHWSGERATSMESISFTMLLSAGLMPFSTAISKALGMMRIKG